MRKPPKIISVLVLVSFLIYPLHIYAADVLPQGGVVTAGSASFDYVSMPGTLNVDVGATQNIANWQSYSVGTHNTVNYIRDSGFTFLNRVVGPDPSGIFGQINAPNGKIFLVNQNGILFAPGSSVNAAGVMASSLDINNSDFLAGRYTFFGKGGAVVNQGYISAPGGFVALLGSTVENTGVIEANLGSVVLASGEAMTLSLDPQNVISVVIDKETSQNLNNRDSAVKNTGTITADGGKVILTVKVLNGVFNKAVNNEGNLEAKSLVAHDGVVELLADGAKISNTNNITAGKVEVQAKNADFVNSGVIEAQESIKAETDQRIDLSDGRLAVNSSMDRALVKLHADQDIIGQNSTISSVADHGTADIDIQSDHGKINFNDFNIYSGITNDGDASLKISAVNDEVRLKAGQLDASSWNKGNAATTVASGKDISLDNVSIIAHANDGDAAASVKSANGDIDMRRVAMITQSPYGTGKAATSVESTNGNIILWHTGVDAVSNNGPALASIAAGDTITTIGSGSTVLAMNKGDALIKVDSKTGIRLEDGWFNSKANAGTANSAINAGGSVKLDRVNLTSKVVTDGNAITQVASGKDITVNSNEISSSVGNNGDAATLLVAATNGQVTLDGVKVASLVQNAGDVSTKIFAVNGGVDINSSNLDATNGNKGNATTTITARQNIGLTNTPIVAHAHDGDAIAAVKSTDGDINMQRISMITQSPEGTGKADTSVESTQGNINLGNSEIDAISLNGPASSSIKAGKNITSVGSGAMAVVLNKGDASAKVNAGADVNLGDGFFYSKAKEGAATTEVKAGGSANLDTASLTSQVMDNGSAFTSVVAGKDIFSSGKIMASRGSNGVASVDMLAGGSMNTADVSTIGGTGDTITLKTNSGNMEVGKVNASGGQGDVTLTSAANITDNDADSLITANNFNFTAGNLVGTLVERIFQIVNGQPVVTIKNLSGASSYKIFGSNDLISWTEMGTVDAASGATTEWTDSGTMGVMKYYNVKVASASGSAVGTSANPINTDVNLINGVSKAGLGDIYIKEKNAVNLASLVNQNGLINLEAGGKINALNVSTQGGAADSITLKTTSDDIEVGKINAAGGLADVTLTSAANITDNDADSLITANNFNFTAGNLVGTLVERSFQIVNGQPVVTIKNLSGASSYKIFGSNDLISWTEMGTIDAASGATTEWTDSGTMGVMKYYNVKVASASGSAVGTSANPINTDVNLINGVSKAGLGDIYIKEKNAVNLASLVNQNGLINLEANGKINALNVSTQGGSADSITLKTTSDDIEVGKINAAGGLADVTLTSAANITDNDADSLITANNFNFTAGNLVGAGPKMTNEMVNGHTVITIQNISGASSYKISGSNDLISWTEMETVNTASGATTEWTDSGTMGVMKYYKVEVASASGSAVGSSANPINTDVNLINGVSKAGLGDIYIKEKNAVNLASLVNQNGLINLEANGKINALNVSTQGGSADSITLKTTSEDIEVGKINAAGGLADVTLTSAANITDNDADSLITANNFNFTAGNLVGTLVERSFQIVNGQPVVTIKNLSGASSYKIFGSNDLISWTEMGTIDAASGATTEWTDSGTMGVMKYYNVKVASASGSAVGTSANPINTDVNLINGVSKAGLGDIYIKEKNAVNLASLVNQNGLINLEANGKINALNVSTQGGAGSNIILTATDGDINVTNINSADEVTLDSVHGSINGTGAGTHITSAGDTRLTAGNLIGSWDPYSPLSVNVGKDLYLKIGNRNSSASGSVGAMPVSGTLGSTVGVGGVYHFDPGVRSYDATTGDFTGNPPGYIFNNRTEIWPLGSRPIPTPTPTPTPIPTNNSTLMLQQLSLDPILHQIYDPAFRTVTIDRLTTTGVYYYHPLTLSDSTAFDDIALDAGAYDFIDGKVNLKGGNTFSPFYQEEIKKKK